MLDGSVSIADVSTSTLIDQPTGEQHATPVHRSHQDILVNQELDPSTPGAFNDKAPHLVESLLGSQSSQRGRGKNHRGGGKGRGRGGGGRGGHWQQQPNQLKRPHQKLNDSERTLLHWKSTQKKKNDQELNLSSDNFSAKLMN